jgi:hypothetical protein
VYKWFPNQNLPKVEQTRDKKKLLGVSFIFYIFFIYLNIRNDLQFPFHIRIMSGDEDIYIQYYTILKNVYRLRIYFVLDFFKVLQIFVNFVRILFCATYNFWGGCDRVFCAFYFVLCGLC